MAIQKVLKAYIVCPAGEKRAVLQDIQLWGRMEITSVSERDEPDINTEAEENFSRIAYMTDFIGSFAPALSQWKRLKEGLPVFDMDRIGEIEKNIDLDSLYRRTRQIDGQLKEKSSRIAELERQLQDLERIRAADLSADMLRFKEVEAAVGIAEEDRLIPVLENENIYTEKISGDRSGIFTFIFLKEYSGEAEAQLNECKVHRVTLPERDSPVRKIEMIGSSIEELKNGIDKFHDEIRQRLLPDIDSLRVLKDLYRNRSILEQQAAKSGDTAYMSIIAGWIAETDRDGFAGMLSGRKDSCYAEFHSAGKDDDPPVALSNGAFSDPFELVTNLYGTPAYNWIDPTPYLAPFFAFFFGLCLTDAGYGLMITAVSLWALRSLKISGGTRRFMKLMLWGGLASVLTGALTGGWFGNAFAGIAPLMRLRILNPLEKPEYFLYFSVGLGYIQVLFGLALSAVKSIDNGDMKKAFYEDVPWLAVLLSIPVLFLGGAAAVIAKYVIFAGLFMLFGFSGYESPNIMARLGAGLYNIYGGTDHFKDMISYSRLFALGMGTGILAMAANEILKTAFGGSTVFGILIIPVILAAHLLNIGMNILSGYVHTSRLQYVEFFTKFFKGGGRSFSPFAWESENIEIDSR